MRAQTWSSNLFKSLGTAMVVGTIAITAQMVNGQPQPLSLDQLQAVTGGGECEQCNTDKDQCKTEDEETCTGSTAGDYTKKVWTGQDAEEEVTDADAGVMDVEVNTPEECWEKWTSCDKQNGSCVNCESTSTTGSVNSNCHAIDSTGCPAS